MTRTLPWQKPDPVKNYYPVPKVICQLGLSPGEIAVYSFLLFCEDRKTYLSRNDSQNFLSIKYLHSGAGFGATKLSPGCRLADAFA